MPFFSKTKDLNISLEKQRLFISEISEAYAQDRFDLIESLKNELKFVKNKNNADSVLEIGSGGGAVLSALKELNIDALGVEVVPEMIEKAKDFNISNLLHADGACLPFEDNSFDLILSWGNTLGPIPGRQNRIAMLSEALRVLKDSGVLLINVLNHHASLKRFLQPLEYSFHYHSKSTKSISKQAGYNRFYSYRQLKDELNEAGYTKYKKLSKLKDSALIVQASKY